MPVLGTPRAPCRTPRPSGAMDSLSPRSRPCRRKPTATRRGTTESGAGLGLEGDELNRCPFHPCFSTLDIRAITVRLFSEATDGIILATTARLRTQDRAIQTADRESPAAYPRAAAA